MARVKGIDWGRVGETAAMLLWRSAKTAAQTFISVAAVSDVVNARMDVLAIAGASALSAGLSVIWNYLSSLSPEDI